MEAWTRLIEVIGRGGWRVIVALFTLFFIARVVGCGDEVRDASVDSVRDVGDVVGAGIKEGSKATSKIKRERRERANYR